MRNPTETNIPIHKTNPDQPEPQPVVVIGYDMKGKQVEFGLDKCVAKQVTDPDTGSIKHWVKRGTIGSDAGMMLNPYSPTFEPEKVNDFIDRIGKHRYSFSRVTATAFDLYLRFLRSKNLMYLRQAERA